VYTFVQPGDHMFVLLAGVLAKALQTMGSIAEVQVLLCDRLLLGQSGCAALKINII